VPRVELADFFDDIYVRVSQQMPAAVALAHSDGISMQCCDERFSHSHRLADMLAPLNSIDMTWLPARVKALTFVDEVDSDPK
jgi:hypothetical protein